MIYIVKTSPSTVMLFTSKPIKVKHHYLVDSGEEEQDYHGHFHKVYVPSNECFECWEDEYGKIGIPLDISNFSNNVRDKLKFNKAIELF